MRRNLGLIRSAANLERKGFSQAMRTLTRPPLFVVIALALGIATAVVMSATARANGKSGVVDISAGYSHACAVTVSGGVKCWGSNLHGELGDGTTTPRSMPTDVIGLTDSVSVVSAGSGHTCALRTAGGVKCWGFNDKGQLGNGTTTDSVTPVDVLGLSSGVIAVAAGNYHTCAIVANGSVKCWGDNGQGELGDGTTVSSSSPVDVSGLTAGVAAMAAGGYHTCEVSTAGGLKCWGTNYWGELGIGNNSGPETCNGLACSTAPVDVTGLTSGIAAVSDGSAHTCAVTSSGGVKCWGSNGAGQVGDGSLEYETCVDFCRTSPVDVVGLTTGVSSVSAGSNHTCAVTVGGGVQCWGRSATLGNGTRDRSGVPVNVQGLDAGAGSVTTGLGFSCALMTNHSVKCWGDGGDGQLGIGSAADSLTPVDVTALSVKPTPTTTSVPSTSTPTATATPTPAAALPGDANGDGRTNAIDAALILQYSASLISLVNPAADVNRDGRIDAIDAALILQYVAGLISAL